MTMKEYFVVRPLKSLNDNEWVECDEIEAEVWGIAANTDIPAFAQDNTFCEGKSFVTFDEPDNAADICDKLNEAASVLMTMQADDLAAITTDDLELIQAHREGKV